MTKNVDFSHLRYKFMFRSVTPKYVAERMIDALVHRQEYLFITGIDRVMACLVNVLPSEAINKLMNLAGVAPFHLKLMES
ncbi:unnamed protein product [Allacma fusca]|uniref:Uncharacterized protein n=1 Tax=Allacma fusca TaxID=39272 RepID=A0A8J2LUN7_9HEXA|nr:unnamed protein product [Allacma fusca]